jgi:excisionase family DNA binding protein
MQAQTYKREEMIKVAKLANRWGVSRQHVYNLVDRGELPAFRFGGSRGMWVPLPVVIKFEETTLIDRDK